MHSRIKYHPVPYIYLKRTADLFVFFKHTYVKTFLCENISTDEASHSTTNNYNIIVVHSLIFFSETATWSTAKQSPPPYFMPAPFSCVNTKTILEVCFVTSISRHSNPFCPARVR